MQHGIIVVHDKRETKVGEIEVNGYLDMGTLVILSNIYSNSIKREVPLHLWIIC